MENYQALLNDPRWQFKREEILQRDKNTCRRCGLGKFVAFNSRSYDLVTDFSFELEFIPSNTYRYNLVKIINRGVFEIYCKTHISQENFSRSKQYSVILSFGIKGILDHYFNGALNTNDYREYFVDQYKNSDLQRAVYRQINNPQIEIDLESIWFIEKNNSKQFTKEFGSLHIHHKCYRIDYEIWNQNNLEYVTLCNICHDIIHQNHKIPFYDKYQNVSHFLEPCDRCAGNGYINEFRHIQNGICFKCKGNCYFPIKM